MKLPDAFATAGIALIAIGAGLAYLPLGIALAGVFLLLVGLGLREPKRRGGSSL